jgi:membrane peptidoglycan carboxypeptidase
VTSVKNGENIRYEWDRAPQPGVISPEVMTKATYALQQVVNEGSGVPAKELVGPDGMQRPVAGKTGSTNGNKAAWFAGYIPQLTTVVGLYQNTADNKGQDTITPFGEWAGGNITGGTWPVTAWTQYMQKVTEGMEVVPFPDYTPPLPPPSPTPSPTPTPTPTPDDKVEVPFGLRGQQVTAVMSTLASLGLRPVVVEVENEQPPGIVLSVQHEGQEVKRGSEVRVEVSKGPAEPETTQVPGGLVGGDENNARRALQREGLQAAVQYQASEDVAEGIVMDVNPDEGAEVQPNSQVQVIVSSGPAIEFPSSEPTDGTGNGGGGGGNGNP